MNSTDRRDPAWRRYSFAVLVCFLAVGVEILLGRFPGQPIYPFLPAFAAIIASAGWAGPGPGLVSTALLALWAAVDLWERGQSMPNILSRCVLLLLDGALLSAASARMGRPARQTARGEAGFRRLMETAAQGIWVLDGEGVITWANAGMAGMLGVPLEELPGRKADEFFLPEDLSTERIRADNLRSGRKTQFDRRLRGGGGSELWVLACCNLLDGRAPGSLAMMTDITERKRAEYALRRSEERFRNLFENVLEGVYQSTPDGRILAANPMLLRMLGVANEAELNDVNIAHDLYVDPGVRKRLLERLEHEGGFQNVEYELRRRDGEIIAVRENARVVREDNGAILYYEGTLTDITPGKRNEEEQRRAWEVESLSRVAGAIAQDFKNVLTVITGCSRLALSELGAAHPARPSAGRVLRAAESAMALTTRLLSFSSQTAKQSSIDLNLAVERARPALNLLVNSHVQCGLVFSACREPAPVYAGQNQIEQIVAGLVTRIGKAAPLAVLELKTELADLDSEVCARCGGAQPGLYVALSLFVRGSGKLKDHLTDPSFAATPAADIASMELSATHAIVSRCGGFMLAGELAARDQRHGDSRERKPVLRVFLPCALLPIGVAAGAASQPEFFVV